MMPERDDTAAIQAFWMRGAAQNEKCDYLSAEADRLLEEAITEKAYDPMRRVREFRLRGCAEERERESWNTCDKAL